MALGLLPPDQAQRQSQQEDACDNYPVIPIKVNLVEALETYAKCALPSFAVQQVTVLFTYSLGDVDPSSRNRVSRIQCQRSSRQTTLRRQGKEHLLTPVSGQRLRQPDDRVFHVFKIIDGKIGLRQRRAVYVLERHAHCPCVFTLIGARHQVNFLHILSGNRQALLNLHAIHKFSDDDCR